jgi:hypothetical protein
VPPMNSAPAIQGLAKERVLGLAIFNDENEISLRIR